MVRLPPRLRPLFPYLKPAYVRATGFVAPASVRLSRGVLPAQASTLRAAAESTGGRYVLVRPAERVERAPMTGRPQNMPLADTGDGEAFDAVGVAELPNGRVLGAHRAIVSGANELVHDVSWYFGTRHPRQHPLYLNPSPPPPRDVPGRLGVLAARGDGNYYHFLMDVIGKLGVLDQAPQITPPEQWYVPQQLGFQRELLELAGVPAAQVVDAAAYPHVRADLLVVPAPPAMTEKNPPWAVQWLRDRLLHAANIPDGPRRSIYVTRGPSANNRAVVNEAEVSALLVARGFTAIDPGTMSVADQMRAFATAEVIVAPHGAALANLVFASPGATVIELFPAGCLLPDFWRLACGVPGLRYRYLSTAGPRPRRGRQTTIVRDIRVDLAGLTRLLDHVADSC